MYRTAVLRHVNSDGVQKVMHLNQKTTVNSDITWATRWHWRDDVKSRGPIW